MPKVVLGVDAAWTEDNPSGVALAVEKGQGWRLVCVTPSYAHFEGRADAQTLPRGAKPDPAALLAAAERLAGAAPDLVAIDMPLSRQQIVGRRASDTLISQKFGAMGAGTHSPSSTRPGPITDALRADFEARGYPLATAQPTGRAIVEVYPHPALIAFLGKEYRLSYKAGRVRHYWPDLVKEARRENLFAIWREIVTALDPLISGVSGALPLPRPDAGVAALKTFEDQLDAVICAAVGIEILAGRAIAYGDAASAIWVPRAACPAP